MDGARAARAPSMQNVTLFEPEPKTKSDKVLAYRLGGWTYKPGPLKMYLFGISGQAQGFICPAGKRFNSDVFNPKWGT